MRILLVSDNFYPETNAPARRGLGHCKRWVELGCSVSVLTCAPNFPKGKCFEGYRNNIIKTELVEGISIIRLWSIIAPNKGFLLRALDHFSFAISGIVWSICTRKRFDLVICTSPQFFTPMVGLFWKLIKKTSFTLEVRDLWPDSIAAVNSVRIYGMMPILKALESFYYKNCDQIVVVSEGFIKHIEKVASGAKRPKVVMNGADRFLYEFVARHSLEQRYVGSDETLVIGYLGNIGHAQKLELVPRTIKILEHANVNVKFILVGDGDCYAKIQKELACFDESRVVMYPSCGQDEVCDFLMSFDLALVPLSDHPLFHTVVPSKIFEALVFGLPILLCGAGSSAHFIEESGAGLVLPPNDEGALAQAISDLASDRDRLKFFAQNARNAGLKCSRDARAEQFLKMVKKLG